MLCNTCIEQKRACVYVENDEIWTWEPNEEEWKDIPQDKCYECTKRSQGFFGGAPDTCNGEFPCNCCIEQTFGDVRWRCTYFLENGIKKQRRLSHEKLQNARDKGHDYKERQRSKNKKNLKKGIAEESDSESETDDLDEDLFYNLDSDDDSDQGGDQMGKSGDQN